MVIKVFAGVIIFVLFIIFIIICGIYLIEKRQQKLNDDEEYCLSCGKLKKKLKKCDYCGYK